MAGVAMNGNTMLEIGSWLPINEDPKVKYVCPVSKPWCAGISGWSVLKTVLPLISPSPPWCGHTHWCISLWPKAPKGILVLCCLPNLDQYPLKQHHWWQQSTACQLGCPSHSSMTLRMGKRKPHFCIADECILLTTPPPIFTVLSNCCIQMGLDLPVGHVECIISHSPVCPWMFHNLTCGWVCPPSYTVCIQHSSANLRHSM